MSRPSLCLAEQCQRTGLRPQSEAASPNTTNHCPVPGPLLSPPGPSMHLSWDCSQTLEAKPFTWCTQEKLTKDDFSPASSENESCLVVSDSLRPRGLYRPGNSPCQNTGVGSLSLLQGIFPTQVSNPRLPHHRHILYQVSHKGSPRILEWLAYLFSSGSS